jgi:hypothetical protein
MAFYDPDTGRLVAGQRLSAGKAASSNEIASAVEEAVGRCQNKVYKGSALKEMQALFAKYPQLKRDAWVVGEHPCSPLVVLFTKELFG